MIEKKEDELDIVSVVNILPRDILTPEKEIEAGRRPYTWDGDPIIKTVFKSGSTRQFPRFLAKYVVKKMVDEIILHGGHGVKADIKNLRNKDIRTRLEALALPQTEEVEEVGVDEPEGIVEEVVEVPIEEASMADLRKEAKAKGVAFTPKTKKVELIELLKDDKRGETK